LQRRQSAAPSSAAGPSGADLVLARLAVEKSQLGIVVSASFDLLESLRRGEAGIRRLLDHDQGLGREPAAGIGGQQGAFCEPSAVGRIEERERERREGMRRAESGGITAKDAAHAAQTERLDVLPYQRARFSPIVHEKGKGGAARECLEAQS